MPYDLEGRALYPLADLFSSGEFPLADLIPGDSLAQVFDALYYTEARSYANGDNTVFHIVLAFEGELILAPPGTQALGIVFGDRAGGWTALETQVVIGPEAAISLVDVPIALRVPREVLRDVSTDGPAEISFTASFELLGDGSFTIDTDAVLGLAESEIAGTGVTVSASGVAWNFARGATLAEATAAGISGEFIGVAFQEIVLRLPPEIGGAPQLTFDYCLIGTGGFTGGVSLSFNTPTVCDIGGFQVELTSVGIRFQESRLVAGDIDAIFRNLPFFDSDVAIRLKLSEDGLRVALMPAPGASSQALVTLSKPNIISMALTAAELRISSGVAAIRLSGTMTPLFAVPGFGPLPSFAVDTLTIASSGEVSVEGGWITFPEALRVAVGPFALEVTRVGLGTEGGDRWIAFSGGLALAEGIPMSAAVDGLKITWNAGGVTGVELSGVKVALTIEGVLHLEGEVRYTADGQRFDGAATLQLVALGLTVSVRVVIGKRADYTYFYLYLMVAPPVGLPIFQSGLAFYGAEALFGMNMVPGKSASELWYLDWYRRPTMGAIDQTKWDDQRGGLAFGAGVIVGTFPDKGYGVAVKGLLILVLPGPIIMLDARANLLKDPTALALPESQALFTALVLYDGAHGTVEAAIEPHYVFPDGGELIDVTGVAEAFYSFNDPRAWHVYLGRRERERRIRAQVLEIFEANAYLMLEPDSLELGAYIGFDKSYSAGPADITLVAFIEGSAFVSWRPKQLKGRLHLEGEIGVKIAGAGFDISASATLDAQSPQPFEVDGDIKIGVDLPWPAKDFETTMHLHWEAPGPPRVTAPLQAVGISHPLTTATWALEPVPAGGSMAPVPIVPVDARPSIAFDRAVRDKVGIGANATAASDRALGDYVLRSSLTGVALDVDASGVWIPYATVGGTPELFGSWQLQAGDSAQGNRRLILWSRTPYESARPQTDLFIPLLEELDRYDACDPLGEAIVVDFTDVPNQLVEPYAGLDVGTVAFAPGRTGADVTEVVTATTGNAIIPGLPRDYYRCLSLTLKMYLLPRE